MSVNLYRQQQNAVDFFLQNWPGFVYLIEGPAQSGKTFFAYYLLDLLLGTGKSAAMFALNGSVGHIPSNLQQGKNIYLYPAIKNTPSIIRGTNIHTAIFDDVDLCDCDVDLTPLLSTFTLNNIVMLCRCTKSFVNSTLRNWSTYATKEFWTLPTTGKLGTHSNIYVPYIDQIATSSKGPSLKDLNANRETCAHCNKPLNKFGRMVWCPNCEK